MKVRFFTHPKQNAMLSIVFKSGAEVQWHINQKKKWQYKDVADITEIQADGDELEHIKSIFCLKYDGAQVDQRPTIPLPKVRVVRWFGDIAKTIIGNI